MDTTALDKIIVGRVNPHIYAFTTETIPNYLKVGDTYRPVETRLNEWRKHFANLKPQYSHVATTDDGQFFRDYSVHFYLEMEKRKERMSISMCRDKDDKPFWLIHLSRKVTVPEQELVDVEELNKELDVLLNT